MNPITKIVVLCLLSVFLFGCKRTKTQYIDDKMSILLAGASRHFNKYGAPPDKIDEAFFHDAKISKTVLSLNYEGETGEILFLGPKGLDVGGKKVIFACTMRNPSGSLSVITDSIGLTKVDVDDFIVALLKERVP